MPLKISVTLLSHVVLLLASLAELSKSQGHQQSCGNHVVCLGQRPPLPSCRCPFQAGHGCDLTMETECDTELGLACEPHNETSEENHTGVCKGEYDLSVLTRGQTDIELEWSDFAPNGYMFEYILFVREGNYVSGVNDENWRIFECGEEPKYTVRRLKPATVYFFKVAIWEDARNKILGTVTETLMTQTRVAEFCEHQGVQYHVNQTFVHDCEDRCRCLPSGTFQCSPVCPERGMPQLNELDEGCHLSEGHGCCDVRISCQVGGEVCVVDGIIYPHGADIESGCKQCVCHDGELECEYPASCEMVYPSENCPHPSAVEIEGECCPQWTCRDMCIYENRSYAVDESFTSSNCSFCQCQASHEIQCTPECPPVVMVLPDAACPDPHIRNDGCCDTLYCHDKSLDDADFIGSMFALSFSPMTLTLSFEVDPIGEENGIGLYCEYEVLLTNNSNHPWQRRVIQPVDVRIQQDQDHMLQPSEALTTESAIVVGDRAYLTLADMNPDTIYYVKIRALTNGSGIQEDMVNQHGHQKDAMVVVKTMPLKNASSCFHSGKVVHHKEDVVSHCSKRCTCLFGKIECQNLCEDEQAIIAASPSCPQPRLEKSKDDCCAVWKCYPSASGCRFNDLILGSDQSVTSGCDVCTCYNGTVKCVSACPPVTTKPRSSCVLTNLTGHCCPQWKCPKESNPPLGIESSILLQFQGSCKQPVSKFEEEIGQKIFFGILSQIDEILDNDNLKDLRNELQVKPECHQTLRQKRTYRKRRSTDDNDIIKVFVILYSNWSTPDRSPKSIQEMYNASLALTAMLNQSLEVIVDDNVVLRMASVKLQDLTFVCDKGFSHKKGTCVLSELETSPYFFPRSSLMISHVTSNSATLQWSSLNDKGRNQIQSVMLEYRSKDDLRWVPTGSIMTAVTSQTLNELNPNQEYIVRLVALTHWTGKSRWTIAETHFKTEQYKASANSSTEWRFSVTEVSISENYVILYWDHLPAVTRDHATMINVVYRKSPIKHFTHKIKVPDIQQTHAKVQDLEANMPYVAELTILMDSGAVIHSQSVYFVTKAKHNRQEEMFVVVMAAAGVMFISLLIVIVTCFLWHKGNKRKGSIDFVNKTYGLPVSISPISPEDTGNVVNPATA